MDGKLRVALIGSRSLHDNIDERKQADIDLLYRVCLRLACLGVVFRSGLASKGLDAIAQLAFSEALTDGDASEDQFEVFVGSSKDIDDSKLPNKHLALVRNEAKVKDLESIAASFHGNWSACSPYAVRQHSRNVHQIMGYELDELVDAVITWCVTKNGKPIGGTSTALKLAESKNIQIINLYELTRQDFVEKVRLLLEKHSVISIKSGC